MITSEKLVGSENYLSWSASVELWFMGQGYEDHLITQEADIPEVDRVQWRKIDAQLCSVLWQSVDPGILLHLQAYKTCFKFWTQAKGLYTNDIQRLYKVASAIVHLSQQDLDLSTYIGQIASLKEQFLTVMPLTPDVGAQQTQLDKFFMVLTLIGLRPDLEPIRDQILGSSSVPSLDDVFARLLRILSTQTLPSNSASDSSVLVSQTTSRGGRSGTRGRGQRPHCTYCNKLGHTRDRCYQLHGRPPRTAHMAQSSDSPLPQPPSSSASQTSQASIASVAQPGNASACLTHTSSLGPWILDSGASDHLSGNKDLFSSITTTSDLPTVTLANGSQTVAKGIGLALPLPSLPLTSVLYTPECPFNLISISKITRTLNCSITFSDKFVTLQDRSTGKTIGIGRESQGLYHLTSDSSPAVCISTDVVIRILRYIKSTPGQGVLYENRGHTQVVGYTDADWAGSPTDRRSTSGYCVFIGGNLISWKSKKQDVVARSSAETEYRAMALATCELIWLRHLLQELRFGKDEQMKLICDNQAALHIASNPVFHEMTKHIEVDCHFIREKIASGCVATSFVNSNDQLADIFTKSLRGPRIKYICNKLGAYDVYAPA
ncbi:Retrovirus-related Pol polyprotein from transposon RE1 [Vitis vinifera]|uniref:Retrovirus-related Pol polyprotein from transposon RE1 n=1 Tax=Vitis vinifera TaxID=29760 RepID=A0A438KGA9_VITVI|nr:Retrovirus-related Pol polyprotein from transposon RE1 [Vitis vinifera]